MVAYVEAPTTWDGDGPSIFLAGGITGCPDWQSQMVDLLSDTDATLLNPRRADFPMDDPDAAYAQIEWEHQHLRKAGAVLFWFCAASVCPIVLYELGAWSMTDKPIAVGIEPGYLRERDVRIQTGLARPDAPIVGDMTELADAVRRLAS